LPREIIYDRLVKRKKPWALAAASMLLLGCSISYAAYSLAMGTVDTSHWQTAENEASTLVKQAGSFKSDADKAVADFTETDKIGQNLVGNVEGRIRWLELLSALNASLPSDPPAKADDAQEEKKDPEALAKQISQKKELHVTSLECQQVEDVSTWYTGVKHWDNAAPDAASHAGADASGTAAPVAGAGAAPGGAPAGGVAGGPAGAPGGMTGGPGAMSTGTPSAGGDTAGGSGEVGPKGPGWIIQLTGYHYHNADKKDYGAQYVRNTLIEKLRKGKIKLPSADPKRQETVSMADLGVSYPVLVNPARIVNVELPNPNAVPDATGPAVMGGGLGAAGGRARTPAGAGNDASAGTISLKKFDFVVQFCWQPKTPTMRQEAQKAKKAKDELEKKQAGATEQP
jgi:type IV pilus assembly protein PilM